MFTESEIIELLDNFDKAEQYQELVQFVDNLRPEQKTPTILSLQARACNNVYWQNTTPENRHFAERALAILTDLESELSHESSWHFRIAYSYFYLNDIQKAEHHFQKSNEIKHHDVASEFLAIIAYAKENHLDLLTAQDKFWEQDNDDADDLDNSFTYLEQEYAEFEKAVEEFFGEIHGVFRAEDECNVVLIPPSDDLPVYTLLTFGMGAFEMQVPDDSVPKFAELLIHLPPDWDFDNQENRWVIDWLQRIAKMPSYLNTFFAHGHTIPIGNLIANTPYDCFMLLDILKQIQITDEKSVQIYHVMPIFPEETLFKLNNGSEALMDCFNDIDLPFPPILDLNRPNSCPEYQPMALGVESLDNILWRFDQTEYSSLMNFWQALQDYHQDIDCMKKLEKFEPSEIACHGEIYIVYEAYINGLAQLTENETLLYDVEFDGEYEEVTILLKITGYDPKHIGTLELLYYIHENLANKDLGDHVFFEGLAFDEALTQTYQKPVYQLLLGS